MIVIRDVLLINCFKLKSANMMLAVLFLRCMQKHKVLKSEMVRNKDIECCRACMSREQLRPIFEDVSNTCDSICEQLAFASGLQISKDDGLPQQLCENCITQIKNAIKFRDKCIKTEHTLLSLKQKPNVTEEVKIRKNTKRLRDISKRKSKFKMSTRKILKKEQRQFQEEDMEFNDDFQNYDSVENTDIVELYHKDPGERSTKKEEPVVPITLKCNICEKILKNRNTYLKHMIVHTGDYPYMCEQCGKGLMAYTHLVSHMKAKHGWERTDKCSYCGYLALNKSILQIHERRHTGEKPFVCDHCGMGFHRRANLLQHLPVHLTTKTVQCSLCPSAFKSIRFLRTHYNKKHKQKKYTYLCHICKNYFKTTGNVRMHLFRIHGIPKEDQGPIHRMLISDTYLN